jgi:hypothetical protein
VRIAVPRRTTLALLVGCVLATTSLVPWSRARADSPGPVAEKAKRTVKESAKTGGHAARDGALTFGRATRDFFTKGPDAAKRTWKANAATTKANARAGGRAVKSAAKGG